VTPYLENAKKLLVNELIEQSSTEVTNVITSSKMDQNLIKEGAR